MWGRYCGLPKRDGDYLFVTHEWRLDLRKGTWKECHMELWLSVILIYYSGGFVSKSVMKGDIKHAHVFVAFTCIYFILQESSAT